MDDAELLKDLTGLGKPPLSEDDSILLLHMNDVVDTNPDKLVRHRAIGEMPTRGTSTSRYRRFSTLTKLLMSRLQHNEKFRREPPRPRHPASVG